ncbi:MAG: DUF2007 domain-containing protein [Pseudomonadales bacterium]|nr:DUF2007 domain-containing protein [Pseudomonadales bacterium]
MKQIFAAANIVEAYMIQSMLLQSNIHSHLQGDHLQNAVTQTQENAVKVIVEDEDYLKAISIIREWEDKQPKSKKTKAKKKLYSISQIFIGITIGVAITSYINLTPLTVEGIDYNNDSINDVVYLYNGTRPKSTTVDRNLDGVIDLKLHYSYKGLIKSTEADDDFNGSFETIISYKNGNIQLKRSDTSGDGFYNYQISYNNGVKNKTTFIDSSTQLPIKIQYYNDFNLIKSELISSNNTNNIITVYDKNEEQHQ